jgi:hypothetical protein
MQHIYTSQNNISLNSFKLRTKSPDGEFTTKENNLINKNPPQIMLETPKISVTVLRFFDSDFRSCLIVRIYSIIALPYNATLSGKKLLAKM